MGTEPVPAGSGWAGKNEHDSPPRHGRLTVSPAAAHVTLIILRAVDLTAALLDGLFAHPVGSSDTNQPGELPVAYCAKIEFFRGVLEPVMQTLSNTRVLATDYDIKPGPRCHTSVTVIGESAP